MNHHLVTVLALFVQVCVCRDCNPLASRIAVLNNRPIIGVLSQEFQENSTRGDSFIAAGYVKAVESSGARVVPIFINKSLDYYERILRSVNGIVLPGGSVDFQNPTGYAAAGKEILAIIEKLQDSGVNFPVLGICQGFELLMYISAKCKDPAMILEKCYATNEALPLIFKPRFERSRLYGRASREIINILMKQNVTSNHHGYCVTEEMLKQRSLDKLWNVLSINVDMKGLKFISSVEHCRRPIVGIQFHPEKNMFEWNRYQANPHFREAILSARHFYDWLVAESRTNNQSFSTESEESESLIYNYSPKYCSGGYDEQIYIF